MNAKDFDTALRLIKSGDPENIKRGVQDVCNAFEAGWTPLRPQRLALIFAVSGLKRSSDTKVRRWLYKLIGLLNEDGYISFLVGQLVGGEDDEENLSWVCAALFALVAEPVGLSHFQKSGRDFYGTAFELAARYFKRRARPADYDNVKSATKSESDLSYQWISLLDGQKQLLAPQQLVFKLNRHPSPIVAEYSIWAAHRDPTTRLADLSLFPQDIAGAPPNVRRWYYRVLTKDIADIRTNIDLVQDAIGDDSPEAREGLALGLRGLEINQKSIEVISMLEQSVADWYDSEESDHIRRALRSHLEQYSQHGMLFRRYQELINLEGEESILDGGQPFAPPTDPQQIELPGIRRRFQMAAPHVESTSQEETYLLAVDTVDFSKQPDDYQISIFRDLLDICADDRTLRRSNPEDVVTLLTGDGLILAFKHVENRHAPLDVALAMQDKYADLRRYKIRIGIHYGTAFWIVLQDGNRQLIGHAVNWATRVMSAATAGALVISRHYYDGVINPDRNRYSWLGFAAVSNATTKHGEPIEAYEINRKHTAG